jgi:hypothetical protein
MQSVMCLQQKFQPYHALQLNTVLISGDPSMIEIDEVHLTTIEYEIIWAQVSMHDVAAEH